MHNTYLAGEAGGEGREVKSRGCQWREGIKCSSGHQNQSSPPLLCSLSCNYVEAKTVQLSPRSAALLKNDRSCVSLCEFSFIVWVCKREHVRGDYTFVVTAAFVLVFFIYLFSTVGFLNVLNILNLGAAPGGT